MKRDAEKRETEKITAEHQKMVPGPASPSLSTANATSSSSSSKGLSQNISSTSTSSSTATSTSVLPPPLHGHHYSVPESGSNNSVHNRHSNVGQLELNVCENNNNNNNRSINNNNNNSHNIINNNSNNNVLRHQQQRAPSLVARNKHPSISTLETTLGLQRDRAVAVSGISGQGPRYHLSHK